MGVGVGAGNTDDTFVVASELEAREDTDDEAEVKSGRDENVGELNDTEGKTERMFVMFVVAVWNEDRSVGRDEGNEDTDRTAVETIVGKIEAVVAVRKCKEGL